MPLMAWFGTRGRRSASSKKRGENGIPEPAGLKLLRESTGVKVWSYDLSDEERAELRARLERMHAESAARSAS
jgi:hypothetical protein